jgi:hypothetical protein
MTLREFVEDLPKLAERFEKWWLAQPGNDGGSYFPYVWAERFFSWLANEHKND